MTRSTPRPSARFAPSQSSTHTATPRPKTFAEPGAEKAGSLQANAPADDEVTDNLQASLTAAGFSPQDIARILQIVLAPPPDAPMTEAETLAQAQEIYAPSLDELAADFQASLTAAGFSPQDIARILQIVLAPPPDAPMTEAETLAQAQEIYAPSLDELVDDFQTKFTAAGFSPQDIAHILQAVLTLLPSVFATEAETLAQVQEAEAPVRDEVADNLQARLRAAGFSPQDIADILQLLLQPPAQR